MHFVDMLEERIDRVDSRLVVGIDPYPKRLLDQNSVFSKAHPGLSQEDLLREFCMALIDVATVTACAVKPQAAFFESMGLRGLAVLLDCIKQARKKGIPVILDAKRGDIGSTAGAYAQAYLDAESDFSADALTVNPYLGPDTLAPFIETAAKNGRGLFVLVKTSNPGSGAFQDVSLSEGDERLYEKVARTVRDLGSGNLGKSGFSHVGAVVGATYPQELKNLREVLSASYLLIPGYGTQGGTAEDVRGAFATKGRGAVVNASRSIDYAYEVLGDEATKDSVREAMLEAAREAQKAINSVAKTTPSI